MLALQAAVLVLLGVALAPSEQSPIDAVQKHQKYAVPDAIKHLLGNRNLRNAQPPRNSSHPLKATDILTIEQQLDHFNPSDTRTWQQRYYARSDYYQAGGPAFIYIGGETEEGGGLLNDGMLFMGWLAERFGAKMFDIEHRFYGKSHPLPDLTTESLQYLSADQALADLAYLIEYLKTKGDIEEGQKIVVFGGSYPGTLAAWARLKYPELIHAAVSSSAPVEAEADFQEYMQILGWGLVRKAGQWCYDNVKKATDRIVELIQTPTGQQQVRDVFRMTDEFDFTSKLDLDNFFRSQSTDLANLVQSNDDSQPDSNKNINHVCSTYFSGDDLTPDEAMAKLAHFTLGSADVDGQISDWTYAGYIRIMQNTEYTQDASGVYDGRRQWLYQTCSEFGFFLTFTSGNTPFPKDYTNIDYFIQLCKDAFGTSFDLDEVNAAVNRNNLVFGGKNPDVTNVFYINGDLDPWAVRGVLSDLSSSSPAFLVEGGAHTEDMNYPNPDIDSASMTTAHEKVYEFLQNLL